MNTTTQDELIRKLPGTVSVCPDCREPIVWARLVATTMNRGGKDMAFNLLEDPEGRVAIRDDLHGRALARPLEPDEDLDTWWGEVFGMPHSVTCQAKPAPKRVEQAPTFDGSNVTELAAWRRGERD